MTGLVGLAGLGLTVAALVAAPAAAEDSLESTQESRWTLEDRDCARDSLAGWDCYTLIVPLDWDNVDDTRTASIAGHLRRYRFGRAAVCVLGQIRIWVRLAKFCKAHRA